jgi:hypothetical protein
VHACAPRHLDLSAPRRAAASARYLNLTHFAACAPRRAPRRITRRNLCAAPRGIVKISDLLLRRAAATTYT